MRVVPIARVVRVDNARTGLREDLGQQSGRVLTLGIFEVFAGQTELHGNRVASQFGRRVLFKPARRPEIVPAAHAPRPVGQDDRAKFSPAPPAFLDPGEGHKLAIVGVRADRHVGDGAERLAPIPASRDKNVRPLLQVVRHRANVAPRTAASISTFALAAPGR